MYRIALHIFPVIQLSLFVVGVFFFWEKPIISVICLLGSALFLNFSLHITIHHFVHFKFKNKIVNTILELCYSLTLALPFNFYRVQHFNHHRYNNLIGDSTSTWKQENDKVYPKNFFAYSFLWMFKPPNSKIFKEAMQKGDMNMTHMLKMRIELLIIIFAYAFLLWLNPIAALAYLLVFYLGWSFIAITNYGQHLPIEYGDTLAYSYDKRIYNRLFFNNGLHFEHHENPSLNYPKLKNHAKVKLRLPHLLIHLLSRKTLHQK
jgi:fatty acid desaturase